MSTLSTTSTAHAPEWQPAARRTWHPVVDLGPTVFEPGWSRAKSRPVRRLDARLVYLAPGAIDMNTVAPEPDGWIGLLILDGFLVAKLDAGRAHVGWLLGADDLVRPWELPELALTSQTVWQVLTPTRVAVLDREFAERAGGVQEVAAILTARASRTSAWLLAKSLVMACPVVEERLLLLFALYGERWGIVRPDGVQLRLPLTHRLLAALCGVRRPSVTIALRSLEEAGLVTPAARGSWLLRHERPDGLSARPSCWREYATTLGLAGATSEHLPLDVAPAAGEVGCVRSVRQSTTPENTSAPPRRAP